MTRPTEKKLPPMPYGYATTAQPGDYHGNGHVYIVDANDRKIAALWGKPDEKMALADLIIRASGGEGVTDPRA